MPLADIRRGEFAFSKVKSQVGLRKMLKVGAIRYQNTKQYAVSFQTTPYGNQQDVQNFNDNNRDEDWNALWRVRTQRTD